MSLILANIIGWIVAHWRLVAVAAGVCILGILCIFVLRACNKPPKYDHEAVLEAQEAIEKGERQKAIQILAESDVKEQGIDNSIKLAEEATEKAKQNYTGKTNEELAAELERRLQQ